MSSPQRGESLINRGETRVNLIKTHYMSDNYSLFFDQNEVEYIKKVCDFLSQTFHMLNVNFAFIPNCKVRPGWLHLIFYTGCGCMSLRYFPTDSVVRQYRAAFYFRE